MNRPKADPDGIFFIIMSLVLQKCLLKYRHSKGKKITHILYHIKSAFIFEVGRTFIVIVDYLLCSFWFFNKARATA